MSQSSVIVNAAGQQSIIAQPLTQAAFAPFGDVIEANDNVENFTINRGYTRRYHDLTDVDVMSQGGKAMISIFRSTPLALPISIDMMERHPLGSQAFIPMGDNRYLIVVAPPGELDVSQIKVFVARGSQGINYRAGTWHHFCLALDEVSDFLVVDRGNPGHNCDEVSLRVEQAITILFDKQVLT